MKSLRPMWWGPKDKFSQGYGICLLLLSKVGIQPNYHLLSDYSLATCSSLLQLIF